MHFVKSTDALDCVFITLIVEVGGAVKATCSESIGSYCRVVLVEGLAPALS